MCSQHRYNGVEAMYCSQNIGTLIKLKAWLEVKVSHENVCFELVTLLSQKLCELLIIQNGNISFIS